MRMGTTRTYVVTGSASGIGRATARRLEADGARVLGVDLRDAEVVGDLSTPAGRRAVVDAIAERSGGGIDGVVTCAGVGGAGEGAAAAHVEGEPSWPELAVRVNYFGTVDLLERLRSLLAAGTAPRVATITSIGLLYAPGDDPLVEACLAGDEAAAHAALAGAAERSPFDDGPGHVYACTKRAVARWVRRVAATPAWAGAGIAVNAVAPGLVRTPMFNEAYAHLVPMPLHGPAAPEDVAPLLAWLVGEENVLVTGQMIFLDGGAETLLLDRGDDVW
jgi:NAD(P)-dependent dehydrogenase (short-subunit alcohol dehydrogenase family)